MFIESCPGAFTEFEGHEGIFIQGEITPPFADVSVTIKLLAEEDSQPEKIIDVLTDNKGSYRLIKTKTKQTEKTNCPIKQIMMFSNNVLSDEEL